jgi:signal transduction histidine kinase
MPRRHRKSIGGLGWRLFFAFTAILVSLSFVVAFLWIRLTETSIYENAANELRLNSVVLSRNLRRHLQESEEQLNSLRNHGAIVTSLEKPRSKRNRQNLESLLSQRLERWPNFKSFVVYDRSGQPIAATETSWYSYSAKGYHFFEQGLRDFVSTNILFLSETSVQILAVPLSNGYESVGVLVGELNVDAITRIISGESQDSQLTRAHVLNSSLEYVVRSYDPQSLDLHLDDLPLTLRKHIDEDFWADQYHDQNGLEVLGTALKLPRYHWYIVVERGITEVLAPVDEVKWNVGIVTAAMTLLVMILTFFVTRSITRPVQQLVNSTKVLARGEMSKPVPIPKGAKEVVFLATEMDRMRAKILRYQEKLIQRLEESEKKRIESQHLAAIGTMSSTLAHEIRNPLNSMNLLISQVEMSKEKERDALAILGDIRGEISRLDRLVSSMLDYAKPVQNSISTFRLENLLQKNVDVYRGLLVDRNISLKVQVEPPDIVVKSDKDRLDQCIINLLQNAIESVDQSGEIEVKACVQRNMVEIIVSDDGAGLSPEDKERVFDLFYTTKHDGYGLGLSTVKKCIQALGGDVRLEAKPDTKRGAQAVLKFPLNSQI